MIHSLRSAIEWSLGLLDGLPDWAALLIASVVSGVLMLPVLARTTNPRRLTRARSQIAAAVYEVRLFLDVPRRVLAAQGRLIGWTARYVGALALPLAALSLPFGLFCLHAHARWGVTPLEPGAALQLEVALADGAAVEGARVEGPGALTAPPVRHRQGNTMHLRAEITGDATLVVTTEAGAEVRKALRVGPVAAPERARGLALLWTVGAEPPIQAAGVEAIRVAHREPPGVPWWVWWLAVSSGVVVALRRRFGVVL